MADPRLRPGTKHCLCSACGEYFTTPRNFDLHRRWETDSCGRRTRVCTDPHKITNRRGKALLRLNAAGLWSSTEGAYIPKEER